MAPTGVSDDLIARLRARAADPDRRLDDRPSVFDASVRSMSLGQLVGSIRSVGGDLRRMVDANQSGRREPELEARASRFGMAMNTPAPARRLPPLATAADLARAEAALGFPIAAELRRLYLEIADGGFGPGSGLLSLRELVAEYHDLTGSPAGPRGQAWPSRFLPILEREPGYDCLDLENGPIIAFDPEELAQGDSDRHWRSAFKPEADSLGAYFEAWLGAPSPEEERAAMWDSVMEDSRRQFRAYLATLPQDQRAEMESAVYPEFR